MDSPSDAQIAASSQQTALVDALSSAPPETARILSAVQLSAVGAEVIVQGTFPEADVLAALKLMFF